jgi:serine/threonine-protein kinase RsbT
MLAVLAGLSPADATIVATIVSGLARHILREGRRGEIALAILDTEDRRGIAITARGEDGRTVNVQQVLETGLATLERLGIHRTGGAPLLHRLEIVSEAGSGTTVTATARKPG